MVRHKKLRLTPVFLYTDDYYPGPCYVLDPVAWNRGERVVIEVLDPLPGRRPRPAVRQEPPVRLAEPRQAVTWPRGRPTEWRVVNVPVRAQEPAWAGRARELRALGWSERRIMRELGVGSKRQLRKALYG